MGDFMRNTFFSISLAFLLVSCVSTNKSIEVSRDFKVESPLMAVGDTWVYKQYWSGKIATYEIIKVHPDGSYEGKKTLDDGETSILTYNSDHLLLKSVNTKTGEENLIPIPPAVRIKFPLYIGAEWKDAYANKTHGGGVSNYTNTYKVMDFVEIEVQGKKYSAFYIYQKNHNTRGATVSPAKRYYSPDVKALVKYSPSWMRGSELISFTPGPE